MVRMMASGKVFSATAVAKAVEREFDGVSKHLRVLLNAKVIALCDHGDRRFAWYHIPEQVRRADGVLDYGFCVVRVD